MTFWRRVKEFKDEESTRPKIKTYKVKHLKGAVGDFGREWWTQEDYDRHEAYVKELKATGIS